MTALVRLGSCDVRFAGGGAGKDHHVADEVDGVGGAGGDVGYGCALEVLPLSEPVESGSVGCKSRSTYHCWAAATS